MPTHPTDRIAARWRIILPLILIIAALPRVLDLRADPDRALFPSWQSDEGRANHNARLKALYGYWARDDYVQPLREAPFYTLVEAAVFDVTGPALETGRAVSVICGLLTVLALFLLARRLHSTYAGLLAAALGAFNYPLIAYSRIAVPTAMLLALTTLAACAFARGTRLMAAVAGLFCGLALLTDPIAILMPVTLAGYWLVSGDRVNRCRPGRWSQLVSFVLGMGVPVAAFLWWQHHNGLPSLFWPGIPHDAWRGLSYTLRTRQVLNLWLYVLPLTILAVCSIPLLLSAWWQRRPMGRLAAFALVWLIAAVGVTALSTSQPVSQLMVTVPPFLLLVVSVLTDPRWFIGEFRALCRQYYGLSYLLASALIVTDLLCQGMAGKYNLTAARLLVLLAATALLAFLLKQQHRWLVRWMPTLTGLPSTVGPGPIATGLCFAIALLYVGTWSRTREYRLEQVQQLLARHTTPGAVVAGNRMVQNACFDGMDYPLLLAANDDPLPTADVHAKFDIGYLLATRTECEAWRTELFPNASLHLLSPVMPAQAASHDMINLYQVRMSGR